MTIRIQFQESDGKDRCAVYRGNSREDVLGEFLRDHPDADLTTVRMKSDE